MSADDAAARVLDEQIDAMLEGRADHVTGELAQVARLFVVDAATMEPPSYDDRALRRRLLEDIASEPRVGGSSAARWLGRSARRATGASVGGAWRARKVALVSMCVFATCATVALADTRTPAGHAMRVAARAVNIPMPHARLDGVQQDAAPRTPRDVAGAHVDERGAPGGRGEPGRGADPSDVAEVRGAGQVGDARLGPDGEPLDPNARRMHLDEDGQPIDDGDRLDGAPRDGQPIGEQPRPGGDGMVEQPRPGGVQPAPDGQVQQPAPIQPQPPQGGTQQPAPTQPKPGGTAPPPGGTAPQPCCQQPAPQPIQ